MPHIVLFPGIQTAAIEFGDARTLIPGIAPGGSQAGRPQKPALRITNVWAEWLVGAIQDVTVNTGRVSVGLKLSQEPGGNPGLFLPVATFILMHAPGGGDVQGFHQENYGQHLRGQIFAPLFVGMKGEEAGSAPLNWSVRIHLEYEMVMVDWMTWFMMWDWLDNIVDNQVDY